MLRLTLIHVIMKNPDICLKMLQKMSLITQIRKNVNGSWAFPFNFFHSYLLNKGASICYVSLWEGGLAENGVT